MRSTVTLNNIKKEGEDFHTQSSSYYHKNVAEWFEAFAKQVEKAIQSNDEFTKDSPFIFHFVLQPSGGSHTVSRERESILAKRSVVNIKNTDNNCFWYALAKSMDRSLDLRKSKATRVAQELCKQCKLQLDEQVRVTHLPLVEHALECNNYVVDMDKIPNLDS